MVKKHKKHTEVKLVVFDFDETIGAFPALSGFLNEIQPYFQNYALIKNVLQSNPHFIRPHMMDILKQLNHVKKIHPIKTVLYTNNPSSDWIRMILHYIDTELNLQKPLFDHVLDATQRQTYDKSVADLLNHIDVDANSRIFFVDDQYHPNMITKDVVYFHITPYNKPDPHDVQPSRLLYKELREFING